MHYIRIIEFLRPICEVVRKGMSFHYTNPFLSYCVFNVILSKNMFKGPLSVAWQAFVVSHVAPSGVKITYLILLLRSSHVTHSLLCNIDYTSSLANIKHEQWKCRYTVHHTMINGNICRQTTIKRCLLESYFSIIIRPKCV